MSALDLIVAVVCLMLGYRFVSYFFSDDKGKRIDADPASRTVPWHDVLGVDAHADRAQIEAAYRSLMMQHQAQLSGKLSAVSRGLAQHRLEQINQPYAAALAARPVDLDRPGLG